MTCSAFPIVNSRQRTKAKSIMALLIVAMMILCGVLVRTFITSSPVHTLESSYDMLPARRVFTHMEYSIVTCYFVSYLEIQD